ncbi:MAG TPA: AAA family ATPase [Candidatus Competibacteraceae bacterium]|nr:AAA family ATPase [Candidatus Competibacteraceae bacterium]
MPLSARAYAEDLGQRAFGPEPADASRYFQTPALTSHLGTLLHIANVGTLIGLIKGDPGSGKTSLLERVVERLGQRDQFTLLRIDCRPDCSLLMELGRALGLAPEELGSKPIKRILDCLVHLRRTGMTVAAVIDDAHHLQPDDLMLLGRLGLSPNANRSGLLHLILFARPEIEQRLAKTTLALPIGRFFTLILSPFTLAQTAAYLEHRLKAAGLAGEYPLPPRTVVNLQRKSAGLPGELNRQARQMLLRRHGPLLQRLLGRETAALERWVAVAALLGLAGGWWLYPRPPAPAPAAAPAAPSPPTAGAEVVKPSPATPPPIEAAAAATPGHAPAAHPIAAAAAPAASPSITQETAPPEPPALAQESASPPPVPAAADADTSASAAPPLAPAAPTTAAAAAPEDTPPAPPKTTAAAPKTPAPRLAAPGPQPASDWLRQRPPQEYMIQLLAANEQASLREFLRRNPLPGEPTLARIRRQDQVWHVLLLGPYADRRQAQSALDRLPPALRQGKPWLRRLGELQKILDTPQIGAKSLPR